jgi:hypothetical protein
LIGAYSWMRNICEHSRWRSDMSSRVSSLWCGGELMSTPPASWFCCAEPGERPCPALPCWVVENFQGRWTQGPEVGAVTKNFFSLLHCSPLHLGQGKPGLCSGFLFLLNSVLESHVCAGTCPFLPVSRLVGGELLMKSQLWLSVMLVVVSLFSSLILFEPSLFF